MASESPDFAHDPLRNAAELARSCYIGNERCRDTCDLSGPCQFFMTGRTMAAELNGPRLAPHSRGPARQLVVFLHGYGADGNDLIELGRAWQAAMPDAAFVSPHAPEPCGQAPTGRQWFSLTFSDPNERWVGVNKAAP